MHSQTQPPEKEEIDSHPFLLPRFFQQRNSHTLYTCQNPTRVLMHFTKVNILSVIYSMHTSKFLPPNRNRKQKRRSFLDYVRISMKATCTPHECHKHATWISYSPTCIQIAIEKTVILDSRFVHADVGKFQF